MANPFSHSHLLVLGLHFALETLQPELDEQRPPTLPSAGSAEGSHNEKRTTAKLTLHNQAIHIQNIETQGTYTPPEVHPTYLEFSRMPCQSYRRRVKS